MLVSGARPMVVIGLLLGSALAIVFGLAQINHRADVRHRGFAGVDVEFIRARATDAVQQGEKRQLRVVRLRFAQPPVGEDGEFLRPVRSRRNPAPARARTAP